MKALVGNNIHGRPPNGTHLQNSVGVLKINGLKLIVTSNDTFGRQTMTSLKASFKQCFHFKKSELHVLSCYQCL